MVVREFLEKGRDLAERIPYSVIALAARFAVADVFWRSGQTKVAGLSIREEIPCWRRTLRHISVPPASASFRFFSFLD
jgi:putative oxidoreductase